MFSQIGNDNDIVITILKILFVTMLVTWGDPDLLSVTVRLIESWTL